MAAWSIDIRFLLTPMMNILLFSSNLLQSLQHLLQPPLPTSLMALAAAVSCLVLFLLYVSITVSLDPFSVRLRFGDFSGPLALSLLVSVIFSPPLFWSFFLLILATSRWHGVLANMIQSFFRWLHRTLQSNHLHFILCPPRYGRRGQNPPTELASPARTIEVEDIMRPEPEMMTSPVASHGDINEQAESSPTGNIDVEANTLRQDQHLQVLVQG